MELKVGFICDRGLNPKRPVNQDRYLAMPERGLFAVFDGVGGQRAGEVASQTAAETIEEALAQPSASKDLIRRAIMFANRDIYEMAESDPAYKTMATTVALLHLEGDRATVAHVGDSRVYRLEDGRIYRETIDHTDLNDDIRAGLVSANHTDEASERNVINRALGVEPQVEVEVKQIRVRDGARFLLCSDGIYRHLSDDQMARILSEHEDPQQAADHLKRAVHEAGAEDNLTAVVVQVGRARLGQVVSIKAARATQRGERPVSAAASSKLPGGGHTPARGGRIQVDFGNRPGDGKVIDPTPVDWEVTDNRAAGKWDGQGRQGSGGRVIVYVLGGLLLMAGAFYGGLRASDYIDHRSSDGGAPGVSEPLTMGRAAFERGDYRGAAAAFNAVLAADSQNVEARYWMGRSQLEIGEYAAAAHSFEQVIAARPAMYDAYLQAAAAYEAAGDRPKSQSMLQRYGLERRTVREGSQEPVNRNHSR